MRHVPRAALGVIGAAILVWSTFLLVSQQPTLDLALFLLLSIPTAWIRMKIAPSSHLSLTPTLAFAAMLTTRPENAVLLTTFSAIFGAAIFARKSRFDVFSEVGEEGFAAVVMVFAYRLLHGRFELPVVGILPAFFGAVICFVLVRFLLAAILNKTEESISFRSFVLGPGRQLILNLSILSFASLGLSYLANTYADVGYFVPALATVSLVEFYYPYKLLSDQEEAMYAGLAMIAQAIDAKDPYTARHSLNVASIAARIARVMGLEEAEVRKVRIGALLHDIGKVGVKGAIIRKPGRLEADEGDAMKRHPVISAEIMEPVEFLREAEEMVRHHHEHYDGTGYPDGLRGEGIPLGSRIILVADAFDAIITDRPYRRGRSKSEAARILREHSGRQFDPRAVGALESVMDLI